VKALRGNAQIAGGGADIGMAEEHLNRPQIRTRVQ
jgi:hypothetical protein